MAPTAPVPRHAWADMPAARPPPAPPRPWARLIVPVAVVAVLWLVGWRELAVVVLVAVVVIGVVTAVSAPARRLVERVFGAIGRGVGQVLTVVLLGVVQLVIFTPVSLLARVLRTDPLDPLAARVLQQSSRWVERDPDHRGEPRRQYGNERYRARAAGENTVVGSPRWIRGAVGGVVLLLAADVALGSLMARLEDDTAEPVDLSAFDFDPLAQEALRVDDAAGDVLSALTQIGIGEPDPFLGWRFPAEYDFASPAVNIVDGVRVTSPPPTAASAESRDVWFFGGSTMYGSGQRDDATIPSWVVRHAADDGITIRATNHGHPAYANWQQVLLLEQLLVDGGRPEVVLFYDGFNDLTLQTQFGVHDEPTHLSFRPDSTGAATAFDDKSVAATVRGWWGDHSAVARAYNRVADLFRDEPSIRLVDRDEAPPIETIDPIAAADAALGIHRRGVEHVEALGRAYGFEPLFFWQPYLYTRDVRTPAEEGLVGLPGYDTDVWFPMTERARAGLRDPIIDLGDALDDESSSVYWDFVHTNERGAEIIADAMLPHVAELLG